MSLELSRPKTEFIARLILEQAPQAAE